MARRRSFRDPITNVLKCHGFVLTNQPGDLARDESDDFALEPGRWQWNGAQWVGFTPPPTQASLDLADAKAKIDTLLADALIPQKVKDFAAALKKVL